MMVPCALVLLLAPGCGKSDKKGSEDRSITAVEPNSFELLSDQDLAAEALTAVIDEMIAGIGTNPDPITRPEISYQEHTKTETCDASFVEPEPPGEPKVIMEREFSHAYDFPMGEGSLFFRLGVEEKFERKWTKTNVLLGCNPEKTRVDFTNVPFPLVTMKARITRSKTEGLDWRNGAKQTTARRDRSYVTKGDYFISWSSEETDTVEKRITRRLQSFPAVTKDLVIEDSQKRLRSLNAKISVLESNPVVAEEVIHLETREWDTKTIEGGTAIAEFNDGTRFEANIVFLRFLAETRCRPYTGGVSGFMSKLTEPATPVKTIKIGLSKKVFVTSFPDGYETAYEPKGCDLEISMHNDL